MAFRRKFAPPKRKPGAVVKRVTPETLASSGTEHGHQCAVFCYIRQEAPHVLPLNLVKQLRKVFAIPNGGLRHAAVANKMKSEGVRAGVTDIFVAVPSGEFCGLFLEMKKPGHKSAVTKEQDEFMGEVQGDYQTDVCDDWADAVASILNYLTQAEPYYDPSTLPRRTYDH